MIQDKKVVYDWGHMIWWLHGDAENTPNLSTAKMVMHPKTINQEHFHTNCHEFIVVNKGEVELITNDQSIILKTEDAYLIQPNTIHYLKNNGRKQVEMTIIYSSATRNYTIPN